MELAMDIDSSRVIRLGRLIILIAFGGIGAWLAFAPLQGAVVAAGFVKVDNNRKTVQHNEGGIVKEIRVHDGEHVTRGQQLILLEDTQVSAAYLVLRSALDAELARQARLQAEATGKSTFDFPAELTKRGQEPVVAELIGREQVLFRTRLETLRKQTHLLEKQIVRVDNELNALEGQMTADKTSRQLAEEELQTYSVLREKNFISGTRLLEQKRMVSDYQSRSEERRADIARTLRLREELQLKIVGLESDYSSGAAAELKDSSARVVELSERLKPSENALGRQAITSPVSGIVLGLKVHTPGAAIGPREPLMDIVPDSGALLIEAQAGVDAIKEMYQGQTTDIRFTALPYRTTPLINGQITYISPDILTDREGRPFYQIHVLPDRHAMKSAGIPPLQPGMAAELYIQTQSRTALEYLLKPITDSLARAFRER